METTPFGNTGHDVTRLGLGLAEFPRHSDPDGHKSTADRVLNQALDGGINLLDTAACYGNTEELIGESVSHRRDEYFLATKAGHSLGGSPHSAWTAEVVEESIDRSLKRMRTDHVDLVQLHSCSVAVLEKGDVIDALVRARDAGKTRFIGLSGDNEAARWGVDSGLFATLQTSYNLVDQHARTKGLLDGAEDAGMGTIIKRPVANNVWRRSEAPYAYASEYFRRKQVMEEMGDVPGEPDDPIRVAMGFVLADTRVDTVIVGTHNPDHVQSNIEMAENDLPIPDETVAELRRRFDEKGADWVQLT